MKGSIVVWSKEIKKFTGGFIDKTGHLQPWQVKVLTCKILATSV